MLCKVSMYAGSPEPFLFLDALSTKIAYAGSYINRKKNEMKQNVQFPWSHGFKIPSISDY